MTDFDRDNSHYPKPAPCSAEHRGEADELAADPANAVLKRQLLDEALYYDDLHDRAAPMPDDMDE